ncbi:MAG: hypothetical protein M1818_005416 [Claussenomyces sp. TS43310]|nr:MAG: hypothetical protein M1818_005416 [Claussenomyces sp. TS43310]
MATIPMKNDTKLSFAKVAASAGKENVALNAGKMPVSNAVRTMRKDIVVANGSPSESGKATTAPLDANPDALPKSQIPKESHRRTAQASAKVSPIEELYDSKLVEAVSAIRIRGTNPSLVVNGSGTLVPGDKEPRRDLSLDDPFQRADSGSDLGTKPPSLDGKSITSGTTFALDEKESLRPDDSASVKAAEDDDACSGRGSIVAGSRVGSEAAARAYRALSYEIPDRQAVAPNLDLQDPGIITPQSGSSGPQMIRDVSPKPPMGPADAPNGFSLFYKQTPDDKLLEALESPKDRLFLLRLEQSLIEFVKDSKEPFIDLPPCNSFCRMLTHKLADYYHMTHQFDPLAGSVRIFRTPFCRLPQTITSFSNPPTSSNTPPPSALPTMKIMRRGRDNGESPSKATSETGSDGKEKSLTAKEKLSREEREAAYNKARERIFGNAEKMGDSTPDTEEGNGMSRSSSVSTRDRSGAGKRGKTGKQRRDDSETFDVRSQYTPYFPPSQQHQQSWTTVPQYAPISVPQFTSPMQASYQGEPSSHYLPSTQQFPPAMIGPASIQPFNQIPQFQRPSPPHFGPHSAPMTAYGSPSQTPLPQLQPWAHNAYQSPYQPRGPSQGASTIPYPYGQLPSTANPADPKSQHPIPGSFNRHAFNPKTQSFIPGAANTQQPVHATPHLTCNNISQPQQYGNGLSYNMSRQGSNNSSPSYHASPHLAARPMMQGMTPSHSNFPSINQALPPNSQGGSHLPHFGNASTLPPKPPPAA